MLRTGGGSVTDAKVAMEMTVVAHQIKYDFSHNYIQWRQTKYLVCRNMKIIFFFCLGSFNPTEMLMFGHHNSFISSAEK